MKQLTGKRTIISSCYKKLSNLENHQDFWGNPWYNYKCIYLCHFNSRNTKSPYIHLKEKYGNSKKLVIQRLVEQQMCTILPKHWCLQELDNYIMQAQHTLDIWDWKFFWRKRIETMEVSVKKKFNLLSAGYQPYLRDTFWWFSQYGIV